MNSGSLRSGSKSGSSEIISRKLQSISKARDKYRKRERAIASQTPVTSQVVVQHRLRWDRPSRLARARRSPWPIGQCACSTNPAPAKREYHRATNRRFARAATGPLHNGPIPAALRPTNNRPWPLPCTKAPSPLQRMERVLQHAELRVSLGFLDRSAQKNSVACHAKNPVENARLKRNCVAQRGLSELYSAVPRRQTNSCKNGLKSEPSTHTRACQESRAADNGRTTHGDCAGAGFNGRSRIGLIDS